MAPTIFNILEVSEKINYDCFIRVGDCPIRVNCMAARLYIAEV